MSGEDLRRAAFHEAGHAVVARFFGRSEIILKLLTTEGARRKIGPANHLARIDQITVCIAGVAAQDLFGFSRPEAGYSDHAQIIELVEGLSEAESLELRNAAYARAREIIKNQKSEVERLAELRPFK